jgi:CRISPR-associated protein Csm1
MTLEGVASHARGRRWLAYLRVDADRIGEAFMKKTGNDPVRVQALSRLLDGFFSHEVQELVSRDFRSIYPVYGGGDDLFVIGPWDQALAFSLRLEKLFATTTGGEITISAGVSLSRPKQHILSKSEEAEQALRDAKKTRRSIHALGETMTWNEFAEVLPQARQVADWHDQKLLPSAFVQDVLSLHNEWRKRKGDWPRYRPVLHYQIERNLGRSAEAVRNWADTLSSPQVWKHAGFIARYVMVASMSSGGEEID